MSAIGSWIEAMRLRTLPVSVAGVIAAAGWAVADGVFNPAPVGVCLLFAILAQVASNFANEYYDYRDGLDRPGREGPRRGVTEGDITPRAMKAATMATLAAACAVGLSLLHWGPWWLLVAGAVIAVGVMAYSAGPYPLSRHGLGEVAVVFFFGIIPVTLTYYLSAGAAALHDMTRVAAGSVAIGLMGANVLVVNNYRDADDDRAVGKMTLAVIMGRHRAALLYLVNGLAATALTIPTWIHFPLPAWIVPAIYLALHATLYRQLCRRRGSALNPLLGMTACNMLLYSLLFLLVAALC